MQNLLSVVVPVYNVEEYLDQAIASIVSQSYKNMEIILVDDGSKDSSSKLCDLWCNKDCRIKVVHKENGGLSDARNVGIEMSKGLYIAFVDSDDFIDSNMYETMIESMERESADVVCCGRIVYSRNTSVRKFVSDRQLIFTGKEAMQNMLCAEYIEESACDKVFKRNLFENVQFPVGEVNEDIVVIPWILEKCDKVVHIGQAFYHYRCNENSISKSIYNKNRSIVIKHIEELSHSILSKYPDMKREVRIFQARYAYVMMLGLVIDKTVVKKFNFDYKFYLKKIKNNYIILMSSSYLSFKDKMQVIMILLHIYGPLWRIKHK